MKNASITINRKNSKIAKKHWEKLMSLIKEIDDLGKATEDKDDVFHIEIDSFFVTGKNINKDIISKYEIK